ncbi:hypothetical protein [Microbacterium sp. No. 7]|uniref:hypothetical protein n=1 Tax=Microbacterium sp. No. 7 TaxID=1714373 RepID=UPI0006CFECC6|nr:hypothetical protein [Microbacterium sp. No. 7]ALJ18984.1 hypothetical protein AOA12_03300 [Microbacterium sp. No. 7]
MSDPNYGEPVTQSESNSEIDPDEAVARANEALADAETAAGDASAFRPPAENVPAPSDAAGPAGEPARDAAPAADGETTPATASDGLSEADAALYEQALAEAAAADEAEPAYAAPVYAEAPAEPLAETVVAPAVEPATEVYAAPAVTEAYATDAYTAPAATEVYPTAEPAVALPAAAPQPIFVQAPEPPLPRGNRGAAALIGLLAAVAFGILYLAAALGLGLLDGTTTVATLGDAALSAVTSWWFWVPVAVFFISFWLLGAIINRGRWGYWVHFSLLVGIAAYGGHLLGQLFQAPFWSITASQGAELVSGQLVAPLAIAAGVFGREVTIWFGAWAARRGKHISELNYEAQREYERTLEAGPRIRQG